jgi:hypothetical protein
VLAEAVGTRTAMGVAGVLVLAAPVLLPSARTLSDDGREGDLSAVPS